MASDVFKSLTVSYKAGEKIVAAGEEGGCMFVVQKGAVRLRRPAVSGGEMREVGLLEKGDFFGERAILDGKAYSADAQAETDCDVVEIGPSVFQRMLNSSPEIAVRMMRKLSARLDRLEDAIPSREEEAPPVAPSPSAKETRRPVSSAPLSEVAPTGRLEMDSGGGFLLRGEEVLVGRYDPVTEIQPEIDLTGVDTKRSVSRRHSRLSRQDNTWQVEEEVGALNGTFVNGVRLSPGQRMTLRDGDVISFGMVRVVFREA